MGEIKMKGYKIECITLWKERAEFAIKRRHTVTGEVHIITANHLNKEETAFISRFVEPYADNCILQWHENYLEDVPLF
jgi:hypothetical protein